MKILLSTALFAILGLASAKAQVGNTGTVQPSRLPRLAETEVTIDNKVWTLTALDAGVDGTTIQFEQKGDPKSTPEDRGTITIKNMDAASFTKEASSVMKDTAKGKGEPVDKLYIALADAYSQLSAEIAKAQSRPVAGEITINESVPVWQYSKARQLRFMNRKQHAAMRNIRHTQYRQSRFAIRTLRKAKRTLNCLNHTAFIRIPNMALKMGSEDSEGKELAQWVGKCRWKRIDRASAKLSQQVSSLGLQVFRNQWKNSAMKLDANGAKHMLLDWRGLALEALENIRTVVDGMRWQERILAVKKTNDEEDHMTVKQLQLEFNEGLIERAIVLLDDPNGTKRTLQFTSRTPIGFSSFRNYALELRRQYLVNRQEGLAVRLGDLIEYVPRLQTNARDFSPADTTFLFNEPGTTHILHKATLAQILKGAVFSDIVGVKEDKPNGLLQFEVGRRINLHTYRVGIAGGELFNISLVQFVRPNATLSKLDGKLRQMPAAYIGRVVNDQILPELIAKPLDLQQYENFNAGMDLNLFILDMQPSKTTFFLNTGFNFGHVSVADTLRQVVAGEIVSTRIPQHFSMPSFRFFPEFAFEVFPDSRLRFYGSYRFQWILGMDERVHLLPRLSSFSDSKSLALKAAHVTQLGATINLAPNIDLFLRYRHFIQNVYWKSAFQQVQVGTTIQFTKKMNPKP